MRIFEYPNLRPADFYPELPILVEDLSTDTTSHIVIGDLWEYIQSGALGFTSVVNTTNTQTLTNKTLYFPKINGSVSLLATSTELNKMNGLNTTKTELEMLYGKTSVVDRVTAETLQNKTLSNVKIDGFSIYQAGVPVLIMATADELNYLQGLDENLRDWMDDIEGLLSSDSEVFKPYLYSVGMGAAATTTVITAAMLKSQCGLDAGINIDFGVQCSLYKLSSSYTYELQPSTAVKVISELVGGFEVLKEINFTTSIGTSYQFVVSFRRAIV